MTVALVPVGPGTAENPTATLKSHEDAIRALQQPGEPQPFYSVAKAKLPDAAKYPRCVALVSDLGVLVASNGSVWINQSTGAPI